jgi:multiple sugar transport system permease protein
VRGRKWAPYALLLPSLAYLAVFFAAPMFQAFTLALQDREGNWSTASMQSMLGDARFGDALWMTIALIIVIIPLQFAIAMSMALVINARIKGTSWWLYLFALPLAVSELAAGIIWFSIFTEQGWLNSILLNFGFLDRPFLFINYARPAQLILLVVIAEAWRATAIIMIILVAGLQGISRDYLEAADVFGATTWQKVRRVILPLLRPTIRVALILRTILAFQVFAAVIAITGRGMTVLANEAYRTYAVVREPRVAAAYAALILLLSVIATAVFFLLLPAKEEQYTR